MQEGSPHSKGFWPTQGLGTIWRLGVLAVVVIRGFCRTGFCRGLPCGMAEGDSLQRVRPQVRRRGFHLWPRLPCRVCCTACTRQHKNSWMSAFARLAKQERCCGIS